MNLKPEVPRTPTQWETATGIKVLDPDGWREADKSYDDKVTLAEFRELCVMSTISVRTNVEWR